MTTSTTTRRGRLVALTLAAATALTLAASSLTTTAQWRVETSSQVGSADTDTFAMAAAPADLPMGPLTNTPGMTITNQSATHRSWVDVQSAQLSAVPAGGTVATNLRNHVRLDYRVQTEPCSTGTGVYWPAKAGGATGTTFTRASTQVTGADLQPGQTRHLCPWVQSTLDLTTLDGQSRFLRDFAARALDVTTTVRQRSAAPATWHSAPVAQTNRYRVALVPIRKQQDSVVCRRTYPDGTPGSISNFGGIYWAWPFTANGGGGGANQSDAVPSPAIWAFDIMIRRADGSTPWTPYITGLPGGQRNRVGINSNTLGAVFGDSRGVRYQLKMRAYPFANDRTRYVESDWIQEVWDNDAWPGSWRCGATTNNSPADIGPFGMP